MAMKRISLFLGAAVLILLCGTGATGWYYSERIWDAAFKVEERPAAYDMQVERLDQSKVRLRPSAGTTPTPYWRQAGVWGLQWGGGYGQVRGLAQTHSAAVVREFALLTGGLSVADNARIDSFAWPEDPLKGLGVPYAEVRFQDSLGTFPAWYVAGDRKTWVIASHGKGSSRGQALRILPTLVAQKLPVLVISYRNDENAPAAPQRSYRYGQTEWEEVQAAVRYALEHGARDVILLGYSMGGAMTVNFLYRSEVADRVRAVILDSPMLDFKAVIDFAAKQQGLPCLITKLGEMIAGWRFNIDWRGWSLLRETNKLRVPILLMHGTGDRLVPIETSDVLAAARPDLVTYVRFDEATHTHLWNADAALYERTVKEFLMRVSP